MNKKATAFLLILFATTVFYGCGRPQVEPENLHLIASLRTALSARNLEWLEQNADMIAERYESGKMSEAEFAEFQAILDEARAGDWEAAENDTLAFQKAQRPTDEQVARVRRHWE